MRSLSFNMDIRRWRGHSLTEYGLVAALVCVVSMVGIRLLGQTLNLSFGNMIPGPANVANVGNLNGSSGNGSSEHLSGNSEGMSGGGVDDILTSTNPNGHGDNAPGTVQTSGGLGNQDGQGSAAGQQMGGNQSGPLVGEEESPTEGDLSPGGSTSEEEEQSQLPSKGTRIAQQLDLYSAQLRAFAAKFESSSTLHHYILDIAEKNENLGGRVIEYENAKNQGVSPQQGMMMGRGLGYSIREYETIMMHIHQGHEYPQLSLQDKETLNGLTRDSMSAANGIFTADP